MIIKLSDNSSLVRVYKLCKPGRFDVPLEQPRFDALGRFNLYQFSWAVHETLSWLYLRIFGWMMLVTVVADIVGYLFGFSILGRYDSAVTISLALLTIVTMFASLPSLLVLGGLVVLRLTKSLQARVVFAPAA